MNTRDCMNGIEHSIAEIDDELRQLIPRMNRKMYRGEVLDQIDNLLDHRNLLTQMLGEITLNGELL